MVRMVWTGMDSKDHLGFPPQISPKFCFVCKKREELKSLFYREVFQEFPEAEDWEKGPRNEEISEWSSNELFLKGTLFAKARWYTRQSLWPQIPEPSQT